MSHLSKTSLEEKPTGLKVTNLEQLSVPGHFDDPKTCGINNEINPSLPRFNSTNSVSFGAECFTPSTVSGSNNFDSFSYAHPTNNVTFQQITQNNFSINFPGNIDIYDRNLLQNNFQITKDNNYNPSFFNKKESQNLLLENCSNMSTSAQDLEKFQLFYNQQHSKCITNSQVTQTDAEHPIINQPPESNYVPSSVPVENLPYPNYQCNHLTSLLNFLWRLLTNRDITEEIHTLSSTERMLLMSILHRKYTNLDCKR